MIFVVTGVHVRGFNRLVKAIDELARDGVLEDVFIQTGFSTYVPKHCRWQQAIEVAEFDKCLAQADLVISHGGAGCIAGALEHNKPIVVVPRLKERNEASNDNQLDLTRQLEREGRILVAYDVCDLRAAIERAKKFMFPTVTENIKMSVIIHSYLMQVAKKKGLALSG